VLSSSLSCACDSERKDEKEAGKKKERQGGSGLDCPEVPVRSQLCSGVCIFLGHLRQKARFREKPFALQLGSGQREAEKHSTGQSLQTGSPIVSLGLGQNIQQRKGARSRRCLCLRQFQQYLSRALTNAVRESPSDRHLLSLH